MLCCCAVAVGSAHDESVKESCHEPDEVIPICGTCLRARQHDAQADFHKWRSNVLGRVREMISFWGIQEYTSDWDDERLDFYLYRREDTALSDTEIQELERMTEETPMLALLAASCNRGAYEHVRCRYVDFRIRTLFERQSREAQRDATFRRWCAGNGAGISPESPWWFPAKQVKSAAAHYAVSAMEGVVSPHLRTAALDELRKVVQDVCENRQDADNIFRSLVFIAWLLTDDELREWKIKVLRACRGGESV